MFPIAKSIFSRLPTKALANTAAAERLCALHTSTQWRQGNNDGEDSKKLGNDDVQSMLEELQGLRAREAENEARMAELDDKYKRALATSENVRRRAKIDVENAKQYGISKFANSLIQVADVFDLAIESAKATDTKMPHVTALVEGMDMTRNELYKVFKAHGLERYDPLNEKFEPNFHEAVFEVPDANLEPGTVAVVQKCGYKLNGRVIRAAAVGVSRAPVN